MDSTTPTPGNRAKLDDAEIYRLHLEGLPYDQIMARVGCSKGGVSKAITRWKAQHPEDRNGDAPGGVTAATPGMTPAVTKALNKATALAKATAHTNGDVPAAQPPAPAPAAGTYADLTAEQARELTDQIKVRADALWDLIVRAFKGRAWVALNYGSWDDYCAHELPHLRVPREEREAWVASLKAAGMSNRAAAAGLGVSEGTVRNVNAGAQNYAPDGEPGEPIDAEIVDTAEPEKITGRDGKSYPPKKPPAKKPTPTPPTSEPAASSSNGADGAETPDLSDDLREESSFEDIAAAALEREDDPAARQAHELQADELDLAASELEDAASAFQYGLDDGLLLSPEEARKLAERINPALSTLLTLQEALEELGAVVVTP